MRNYDFAPLTRSTVGFDRVFDLLDSAFTASQTTTSLSDAVIAPVVVPLVDAYSSTFALSRGLYGRAGTIAVP